MSAKQNAGTSLPVALLIKAALKKCSREHQNKLLGSRSEKEFITERVQRFLNILSENFSHGENVDPKEAETKGI